MQNKELKIVEAKSKKFSAGKALGGAVLLGPLGLFAGTLSTDELKKKKREEIMRGIVVITIFVVIMILTLHVF